jgi:hypothetical protein
MVKTAVKTVAKAAWWGVKKYCSLVGEVVFEMAFDAMLRLDKSQRPLGGGASFLMVMTVSVVVSSAIGYLMKKGGNGLEGDDFSFKKGYEHYGRYVKDLQVIGAALALAMIAQRIPVMQATSA